MTTVGYGDIVPVTLIGHIIGTILILTGMGYLSLVTATLAFSFIELFRKESGKASNKLEKAAEGLKSSIDSHDEKIGQVLKRMDEIEKKLDEMEKKR